MDFISIDTAVKLVADHFAAEVSKFRAKSGRSGHWQTDHITLHVDVSEKVEFRLEYSGAQEVRAATLGALMDEVYRRAGFDDREAGRLQAASEGLLSLPAPEASAEASSIDDEIKF